MSLFKMERLPASASAADASPHRSILIVDDEDGNLRVLRSMLGDRFRVFEARDGREALELIEGMSPAEMPSVILSDHRMPRMTGVELFEQLRERAPSSMRIIITGFVDVGAIVDAINRAGIYKFVVKPFDRQELLLTVERAIEAYQMRRQIDDYIEQLEHKVRERTSQLEDKNQALQDAYAELERISLTDPLTGLGNRRFLTQRLAEDSDTSVSERRGSSSSRVAFMLVDIDHFKLVNDRHGHAAGDAVLTTFGALLRQHCRDDDIAVRWGGEEFLMRISADDEAQALHCAARLRESVAATVFDIGNQEPLALTCSIGIACLPFDPAAPERFDWERVLSIADAALYMAKRDGRNAAICLRCNGALPDDFEQQLATSPETLSEHAMLNVLRNPD